MLTAVFFLFLIECACMTGVWGGADRCIYTGLALKMDLRNLLELAKYLALPTYWDTPQIRSF